MVGALVAVVEVSVIVVEAVVVFVDSVVIGVGAKVVLDPVVVRFTSVEAVSSFVFIVVLDSVVVGSVVVVYSSPSVLGSTFIFDRRVVVSGCSVSMDSVICSAVVVAILL